MYSVRQTCHKVSKMKKLYFSSSAPEIVIPPRVERGPTDILAALAGTVGKDKTAPHYRYHDDPWLIPYQLKDKREYVLSKESGRKAAQYIMNQHPDLFSENRIEADPPVNAFLPRVAYNRDNVTVELLENLVSSYQVQDSIAVYNLLKEKKKIKIPDELYQSLLELVAFYNEGEALEEGDVARGIVHSDMQWIGDGFVASEYSAEGEATPGQRLAMLLGQAKHGAKVWQLLEECRANGDTIPVEAYNFAIERISQNEGIDPALEKVNELLTEMRDTKVAPNNGTLVSILQLLAQFAKAKDQAKACRVSLDYLAEFRVLGLDFSLAVYKQLLDIYVPVGTQSKRDIGMKKSHDNRSGILSDILKELEGKEFWPAKHHQDFWFFPIAMRVCNVQNNAALAWRVDQYLQSGRHALLLSDFGMESVYYSNFLSCVINNDEFEVAMKLYSDLVPHTCSPSYNMYETLINAMHTNAAMHHLPQIWEDLQMSNFGSAFKENQYILSNQIMQVMLANDPSTLELTGMSEIYLNISEAVFKHLEENKDNKRFYLRFNSLAATICNNVILVSLREGNFELPMRVMKFCVAEKNVMPSQLKEDALEQYLELCTDLGQADSCIECVEYAVDTGSRRALGMGLKVASSLQLDAEQKDYMNKLFANSSEWTTL